MVHLAITPLCSAAENKADKLSQLLGIPLTCGLSPGQAESIEVFVEVDEAQIFLRLSDWPPRMRMNIDLASGKLGYRQARFSGQSELLRRATGADPDLQLSLLDATAGMGTDTIMLAAFGFRVTGVERCSVLALMLAEALQRARSAEAAPAYLAQVEIEATDALEWLQADTGNRPDVIYLDPMFPERSKTAQVKKSMQLLQTLLRDETDNSEALLTLALDRARYRVVVKRPLRAPPLAGRAPSHHISGKSIRFDVYTLESMRKRTDIL
jgi:16S rRNA (guanine1516-N2)-methyltransferase